MENNWFLKHSKLFEDIDKKEKEYLSKASIKFSVNKYNTVFFQGDTSNSIYFLESGRIKISRLSADGRKLTIDIIEPGDFFGELSLAGEKERRATAEAVVDSSGYKIGIKAFEVFLSKRPDIAIKLLKMIGDRKLIMENLLEDMIFMDVPLRIVSLLLKYSNNSVVKIHLTHQEIADMTGTTRVSVSRSIAKMRGKGLIETKGGLIKLLKVNESKELVS